MIQVGDLVTLARSNEKIIGLVTKITEEYQVVWVRWFDSHSERDIDKSVAAYLLQKYVTIEERGNE